MGPTDYKVAVRVIAPNGRLPSVQRMISGGSHEHLDIESSIQGLVAEGTGKPTFADAGGAAQDQIVVRLDPLAGGELVEQGAIETARGSVIDILDDGIVAQPGIAQAGGQTLVTAMGDLAIDEQTEPIGMGQGCPFPGGFEFGEGLGHAGQPELGELIEHRMGQHFHSPSQLMVVAGAADVWVEHRDGIGRR
jgi:hypothetical protein